METNHRKVEPIRNTAKKYTVGNDYDCSYQSMLYDILANGEVKEDRTGVGTHSVFGRQLKVDLADGFPLLTTKKVNFKPILGELLWEIAGGDNIRGLLQNDVHIWTEWPYQRYKKEHRSPTLTMKEFEKAVLEDKAFGDEWGALGPVYGSQWVNWNNEGIDQLDQAILDLMVNPDSRRIMVTAWNPGKLRKMLLPPCPFVFQFWTRLLTGFERRGLYYASNYPAERDPVVYAPGYFDDGRKDAEFNRESHVFFDEHNIPKRAVSLMFTWRSVDTFLGMPFDIASYSALLSMVGQCVNMMPEFVTASSGDTHIYLNHVDAVKEQLGRDAYDELPRLWLNPAIKNIKQFTMDDVKIVDYKHHPAIKGEIAV